ncbi:acyl-CoA synthetase (AMP-forming)/AMP-acid ligase II [Saccharothrix saharensis]|uniref:Acyl-CoA synthetase (AMP-forming)/AMP-acid ligase II n=1 Tax=Saccharothrix saharensis TaxID=571190 RepID=A0A543J572_9PSEU|nr:fatty acyl-AMP ligase [Saccharothrix saharensis]TQM77990.1 acyl-CoA synthetase (AMP-forming)/AMP-acid ligase II [Saccharothrix saharensis]
MTVTATTAGTVVDAVRRWARERPDHAAFTFLDHEADPRGVPVSITWAELDARACGLAGELRRRCAPGDRALLLLPQGLDYVVAFVACLYADVLAVPLFPIAGDGHRERLDGILRDCAPKLALTCAPVDLGLDVVVVGGVPPSAEPPAPGLGGPAYLQYTSGSTRTPAGVVVTDRNLRVNVRQALTAYGLADVTPSPVSWLPLFHDMGLVLGVGVALTTGAEAVLMDPLAFLYRPSRWLRAMSGRRDVISAGPNFAYDLCVRRVPAADRSGLDLGGVVALINGSEPVLAATVARFQDAFEPCGLRPDAQRPSYGLAEATVFVTAASRPTTTGFDRAALARGRVVATEDPERASVLVGCGGAVDQHLAIVDPVTGAPVAGDRVGEIWVCGENVSPGYWSGARSGEDGFGARLDVPGLPAGPWLRTGDLGALRTGELYVVGRIKDLIVIDGRNHYPQDVEAAATEADDVIRRGHVAAFAVPSDGGEALVVVAERTARTPRESVDQSRVRARVRAAVSRRYDVRVRDVLVVEPGSVPRTSSGKLSRSACRDRYLAGDLPVS